MAAPIKKRPQAPWKQQKQSGRPKESLNIILKTLAKAPGIFEELCERTSLSRTTLNEGLAELETKGRIERIIEPPKERGRGKKHRIVIRLSEKELTPVGKTLRHLETATATPQINVELGRKLLTGSVVEEIIDLGEVTPGFMRTFSREELAKRGLPVPPRELDEIALIRVLACYKVEREPEQASVGYLVLPSVKEKGLKRQFDELLKWIEPLREYGGLVSALFDRESKLHSLYLLIKKISLAKNLGEKEKEKEGGEKA